MHIRLIICSILLLPFGLMGQSNYTLSFSDSTYRVIKKKVQTTFKSSKEIEDYLRSFQYLAYQKGYLLASFDNIFIENDQHYCIDFSLGRRLQSTRLSIDRNELMFLKTKMNMSEQLLAKAELSPNKFAQTLSSILRAYIDNGYPFAKVYLDSIHFSEHSVMAILKIERGIHLQWSKIHLRGESQMSERMIANIIKIRTKNTYNEKDFEQISKKIQHIPFLEEIQPAQVLFTPHGAELYTYLKSKPTSSINGIIGIQPKAQNTVLALTGELSLRLQNVFKHAENIQINWKGLSDQTQELSTQLNYPYLFNTAFGISGAFDLHKSDSTFMNLKSQLSIDYYFSLNNVVSAFYSANSSNLLVGANSTVEPNLGNVKIQSYGIALSNIALDYLPNPQKGRRLLMNCAFGTRTSSRIDTTLQQKSTVIRASLDVSQFVPIFKRNVVHIRNQTHVYSAPNIYTNETYRYGGLNTQRGFDEQELHATAQTTFSLEWRFLIDKSSFVFLFFDQTWYENNAQNYYKDTPYGFGTGFSFATNVGMFAFTYALGKQFNNPLFIRNGKIHFGYTSFF